MSIYKAKNTEDAIALGLEELNLTVDTADIEIITAGGLFKKAEVNITAKCTCSDENCEEAQSTCADDCCKEVADTAVAEDISSDAETKIVKNTTKQPKNDSKPRFALHENDMPVVNFLKKLFEEMEFDCTLATRSTKDILSITINGDDSKFVIGYKGEALDNLQYLCLLVANKKTRFKKKLVIDAEGYRDIRSNALTSLALKFAQKAITTNRSVELEPMNPFERRIVHTALQENANITTTSAGTDPNRYVVIHVVKTDNTDIDTYVKQTPVTIEPTTSPVENVVSPIETVVKAVETAPITTKVESVEKVGRSDIDIYDNSVSRNFKTGAYKTQSFGNKRR